MVQHSILIIICLLLVLGTHGILAFKRGTSPRFLREHITRSSAPYPDSAAHSLLKIHSTNSNTVTTPSSKSTLKASSFSGESANQNLSPFDSNNEKTPTPWTIPPTTTIIKRFVAARGIRSYSRDVLLYGCSSVPGWGGSVSRRGCSAWIHQRVLEWEQEEHHDRHSFHHP